MTIVGLLNQTVQVSELKFNVDGDKLYAAPETVPARIDYTTRRMLTGKGTEITSIATVYLDKDVDNECKITLPDGTERTAIQVNHLYDGAGRFHHCEVSI